MSGYDETMLRNVSVFYCASHAQIGIPKASPPKCSKNCTNMNLVGWFQISTSLKNMRKSNWESFPQVITGWKSKKYVSCHHQHKLLVSGVVLVYSRGSFGRKIHGSFQFKSLNHTAEPLRALGPGIVRQTNKFTSRWLVAPRVFCWNNVTTIQSGPLLLMVQKSQTTTWDL